MTQLEKVLGPDLTQILKKASHELSIDATKDVIPTGLVNPEQQAALLETQTLETFEKLSVHYLESARLLRTHLDMLSRNRSDIHYEKVISELQSGQSLSQETLHVLTDAAKSIFLEKQYTKALHSFSLLCSLDPDSYENWVGLGHSAFHTHQYDGAILAYYMATSLDPVNPWPLIWAANACEQRQDQQGALELLERARVVAQESEEKAFSVLEKEISERIVVLGGQ